MEEQPSNTTGAPLKWLAQPERLKPQEKAKASKVDSEVTTLIEGDLNDIENTVWDTTQDAVDKAMSDQQIVLGELRT